MIQTSQIISGDLPDQPYESAEGGDWGDAAALDAGLEQAHELRVVGLLAAQHGLRLDRALADRVPEFSRSYLQQLIESGALLRNGVLLQRPAAKVQAGDVLSLTLRPTLQSKAFAPEIMALETVYLDAHLRVIHKPAGMVVHPAPGNWSGTLMNGLLGLDPQAVSLPRAGIVHRLDKDTSGLMLVARSRPAMDALVAMIAARQVSRQYLALAHKPWQGAAMKTVDAAIGRDPRNRLRMAVVDLQKLPGKSAQTDFHWLGNAEEGCLLRCVLHTGRTHQIRVHLASLGHPLIADALYGGKPSSGLARQALHAYRLALKHPITHAPLDFSSELPVDMVNILSAWGLRYNLK